jgi:putative transcriptional regulator
MIIYFGKIAYFAPSEERLRPGLEITPMMKLPKIASALFALLLLAGGTAGAVTLLGSTSPATSNLTGQFLVASQQLTGANFFSKTVIYIIAYSDEGTMGVIVNRVFGTTSYNKLLAAIGIKSSVKKKVEVYLGGPVEIGRGLILHSPDYTGASTQQLSQSIAVSTGQDVLQALAEGKGPKQSRIMLGYTGWGAGQLDHEMARGDWLVAPADPSLIFSADPDEIWGKALMHKGISL